MPMLVLPTQSLRSFLNFFSVTWQGSNQSMKGLEMFNGFMISVAIFSIFRLYLFMQAGFRDLIDRINSLDAPSTTFWLTDEDWGE